MTTRFVGVVGGKILVAGSTGNAASNVDFALLCYDTNGVRDTTFGDGDGIVTTDFEGLDDIAAAVLVQRDGRIVLAGTVRHSNTADTDFGLARYSSRGERDNSFGVDGWALTHFLGAADDARAAVLQADGKIIVVGRTLSVHPSSHNWNFAIARYDSAGHPDPLFGEEGRVRTDFDGAQDFANGVALQDDGKIVVVGQSTLPDGRGDWALARYLPEDGRPDPEFGGSEGDGLVTTDFSRSEDEAFAVAMQRGRIVAGGSGGPTFAVARYFALSAEADLAITKTASAPWLRRAGWSRTH